MKFGLSGKFTSKLLFRVMKPGIFLKSANQLHLRSRFVCVKCLSANRMQRTFATHYDTLGVQKDAHPNEIKKAYIEKTKRHHPDAKDSADTNEFLKISEAYNILSNSSLRREYDFKLFGKSSDFNRFETGEYNLPRDRELKEHRKWEERAASAKYRKTEPIIDDSVKLALSGSARLVLDYLIGGLTAICITMYLISRYQKRKQNDENENSDSEQ